ncbi:MAG: hypothetical protein J0L55_02400 [Caulobacterales bacterium]|nr:hypothetical protein [Caulobacterales bacterium]MCA0371371.1 hypothetical protein [Pseudomonadota bacterium]
MKVIDKSNPYSNDEILEVYGVYEVNNKCYYLCSPQKYEGLMALNEGKVEIIDNTFSEKMYFHQDKEISFGVYHWAIYEDYLFDGLSEHDPNAYAEFVRRLGREP